MIQIPGYLITQTLEENSFVLCKAIREKDQLPVVIKSTWVKNVKRTEQLEHEFEIAPKLDSSFALKPVSLEHTSDQLALVYEEFQGESLQEYLRDKPLDLKKFLRIAISIVVSICKLHDKGVIHKDIKPHNILINADTEEIRIIDFGISSILPSEHLESLPVPGHIEGTLPYISPEQTGRMNRSIDYRTDFYSLGVTFYQMLTGRLPFTSKDPLELIYSHIAIIPETPHQVLSEIPETVSAIIMKLLSKPAEDRYQTHAGLSGDLKKCFFQLIKTNRIVPFTLAENDISEKLHLSQKLYGREKEVAVFLNSFEEVVKSGVPGMVFISGYSGIGKTFLVNEIHKSILKEKGLFISGKFDQYKRDIPYFTIIEAFRGLIRTILSETEDKIIVWRDQLLEALGVNGQLMVDLIPQIELIIGPQPIPVPLPPTEAQNRFNLVFEKFIGVFSKKEHSLIIFLDDLQWVDADSLKMLKQIVSNPETKHLFLIGAYRDNEVYPGHPLVVTLEEIKKTRALVREIKLSNLTSDNVEKFIADSLRLELQVVQPLADLVFQKTAGNPFFIVQFLTTIYKEGLLKVDKKSGKWTWMLSEINAKGYTDNVIEFIVGNIKKISEQKQTILMLAACIGNKFDKEVLSGIASQYHYDIDRNLRELLSDGLIVYSENNYQFFHDRFQQAAYSLASDSEVKKIHLEIGRLMASEISENEIKEHVFEIINHYNLGSSLVEEEEEKIKIAHLNLIAAQRAKTSMAFTSVFKYLSAGMEILPQDSWMRNYEVTFNLYFVKAEYEFLSDNSQEAERILNFLLDKAKTKIDKVDVYRLKITLLVLRGDMPGAVSEGLECLKLFGIVISPHPTREEVLKEYEKVLKNLERHQVEDLLNLPLLMDPEIKAAMNILSEIYAAAYFTDHNLVAVYIFTLINLTLKHGNSEVSSMVYSSFGFVLIAYFGNYKLGFRFAKVSLSVNEKYNFSKKANTILVASFVFFWNRHVNVMIDLLRSAFKVASETGDKLVAGYCMINLIAALLIKGLHLDEIGHEIEKGFHFFRKMKHQDMVHILTYNNQFVLTMKGLTDNFSTFNTRKFNEDEFEKVMNTRGLKSLISLYYIINLQARFIAGNYKDALVFANKAGSALLKGMSPLLNYYYYYSLTLTAIYEEVNLDEKDTYLNILRANQKILQEWSENCPDNFLDKYLLVSAEISRITGKEQEAIDFYEEAIRAARKYSFIHNEALCFELASRFYRSRNFEIFANAYLAEARDCYAAWGASGKVKQLEVNFPFLKKGKPKAVFTTLGGLPVEQLDLFSIVKASQSISSQIDFDQLIRNLMSIVQEQAGAQKAYLLLEQESQLKIASETKGVDVIKVFDVMQIPDSDILALSIIKYVKRTQEKVILDDSSLPNIFSNDHYIITNHPKSIACLPILKQAKLIGILYLENNLFTNAFSPDKISILDLLSSQAAISIENANLFKQLSLSKQQLQDVMNNSNAVIFIKQTDGKYLFINQQYEKLFHVTNEEIIGKTDYEVWPEDFADKFTVNDKKVIDTGIPITFEETVPYEEGYHTYISIKFSLLDTSGIPYAVCGISTDITERKRAEEEIHRLNIDLRHRIEELTTSQNELKAVNFELLKTNTDLDNFIYAASHNVRGPVSTLEGLINLLDMKLYEEGELNMIVDMMKSAIGDFNQTIEDLTELSKVQKLTEKKDTVLNNIKEVVEDIQSEIKDVIVQSGVSIKTELEGINYIRFSKMNFKRILNNLILNAINYRSFDRKPEIIIKAEETNQYIILSLTDNGVGINKANKNKVFSMFSRVHGHIEDKGIGLYIAKRIVENYGGKIEFESEEGKGSTFKVYFEK